MVANKETINRIKRYKTSPKKYIANQAFYWPLANPYY